MGKLSCIINFAGDGTVNRWTYKASRLGRQIEVTCLNSMQPAAQPLSTFKYKLSWKGFLSSNQCCFGSEPPWLLCSDLCVLSFVPLTNTQSEGRGKVPCRPRPPGSGLRIIWWACIKLWTNLAVVCEPGAEVLKGRMAAIYRAFCCLSSYAIRGPIFEIIFSFFFSLNLRM